MQDRILQLHGEGVLGKSALRLPGGASTFKRALAGKGYHVVLEIGTFRGCSAAEISQYCKRVITIDLRYGQLERLGITFDRHSFWRSLDVHNIELLLVSGDEEKETVVSQLYFDFAFIDGAHDLASVRRDFSLVRRCGLVLLHDYDSSGREASRHVFDFVNSLPIEEVEICGDFAFWRDHSKGRG